MRCMIVRSTYWLLETSAFTETVIMAILQITDRRFNVSVKHTDGEIEVRK